ncbi:hypothetical protein FXO37_10116 [Capsicum annuum]|nr:hypothetical protein FXO37_10116 [Capsicum annuum]
MGLGLIKCFQWTTNNQMELLALREGLKLVEERNLLPVVINIDSTKVISMLYSGNLLYNSIIDNCRLRLERIGNSLVVHYFKEQNGVADALAKKGDGSEVELNVNFFEVPPMCAHPSLWADMAGTYFVRRIKQSQNIHEGNAPRSFVMNPD